MVDSGEVSIHPIAGGNKHVSSNGSLRKLATAVRLTA